MLSWRTCLVRVWRILARAHRAQADPTNQKTAVPTPTRETTGSPRWGPPPRILPTRPQSTPALLEADEDHRRKAGLLTLAPSSTAEKLAHQRCRPLRRRHQEEVPVFDHLQPGVRDAAR